MLVKPRAQRFRLRLLRKVYDKLGVADRLELVLLCLNNRVLDGVVKAPMATVPSSGNGTAPSAPSPTLPGPAKLS
jgi:hypothetical protein